MKQKYWGAPPPLPPLPRLSAADEFLSQLRAQRDGIDVAIKVVRDTMLIQRAENDISKSGKL